MTDAVALRTARDDLATSQLVDDAIELSV